MFARGFKTRCENMSLQVRKELGLEATDPLVASALAEHLGIVLLRPEEVQGLPQAARDLLLKKGRDSWSAVTISYADLDVIIYNSSHTLRRQSSDIMHELAHILLNHDASKIVVSGAVPFPLREYDKKLEDEADWLAGCLLLPRDTLLFVRRVGMSEQEVCRTYIVSTTLLNYRMNITGVHYQLKASG